MADERTRIERKLSGEEAMERYILILQEDLPFFPKPGVPFKLRFDKKEIEVQIKAVETWSKGPRKPHLQYRIDLSRRHDLYRPHFGQTVTIEKKKDRVYQLT